MSDIYRRLAEKVRAERQRLGWTQSELAERTGFHPAYIGQVERHEKKVSLDAVERLAQALGTTPGDLLGPADTVRPEGSWTTRIEGLLRDRPDAEKEILYSTLRQLARTIRKSRRRS